jgi:hypothetical protein
MELEARGSVYSLPSYSLTGDLLGFIRCGLQYRYNVLGQLPPVHPVQLWFGQFIHGVLEEGYRRFDEARSKGRRDAPPWPDTVVASICGLIEKRLAAQGLFAWNADLSELGRHRARVALTELAPDLFPLIHQAEVRLTGARPMPVARIPARFRNADRYEMVGVVDVVTHVELSDPTFASNRLVKAIRAQLPANVPERFEVILDYKGMRRPPMTGPKKRHWDAYGWQVQTYAHLRSVQDDEDRLPVVAGILVYLNELFPTWTDVAALKSESTRRRTDVRLGSDPVAERVLSAKREHGAEYPPLAPAEFRLRRALRVVPVNERSIRHALAEFDDVVARIETCRGRELAEGRLIGAWKRNNKDEGTCAACDARTWCPGFKKETKPRVPGVKVGGRTVRGPP